jgi:hypothetical protein
VENLNQLIRNRFSFLIRDYSFQGPEVYNMAYENHLEFKKEKISIIAVYEDWNSVMFYLVIYKDQEKRKRSDAKWYEIRKLFSVEEYEIMLSEIVDRELPANIAPEKNILHNHDFWLKKLKRADREIRLNAKIIKQNNQILNGDTLSFKSQGSFFNKLKGIFKS